MIRPFSTSGPAALILIALLAEEARADGPRNVVALSLPTCATPPYDTEDVLHALDVELAGDGLRAELDPGPSVPQLARVVVSLPECTPGADLLGLELSSQRSPLVDRRSIPLAKVAPPARARMLALVIADALRPVLRPPTPHETSATMTSHESVPHSAPAAETKGLRIGAAPQARVAMAETHVLWGLELNAKVPLSEVFALAVEGSYAANDLALSFAGFDVDFDVQLWNAACGVDLNVPGVSGLSVGPRISLAHVSLDPTDSSLGLPSDDAAKLLGLLGARAGLSVPLGTGVSVDLAFEALHTLGGGPQYQAGVAGVVLPGYEYESLTPNPVVATSELEGWMLTAALGIAVRL